MYIYNDMHYILGQIGGIEAGIHVTFNILNRSTSWRDFSDLSECCDSIGHDHGGGVREKVLEQIEEPLVFHQLSVDVV